jgi:hypothetical protein
VADECIQECPSPPDASEIEAARPYDEEACRQHPIDEILGLQAENNGIVDPITHVVLQNVPFVGVATK